MNSTDFAGSELISSAAALDELVIRMRGSSRIALDTEFMQGDRYRPTLALIQVALEDGSVHLIDPLAVPELSGLGRILASDRIVKVLHDPIQDLGLLHQTTGKVFRNIFDTRLAGQLLSLGEAASLSDYVRWLTGSPVEKGPQRSNWLARPLSKSQLHYARSDVIFLLRMHRRMIAYARETGRLKWLEEDMRRFDDPSTYRIADPVTQMMQSNRARDLKPRNRAVLVQLTKWREEMAEKLDVPTRHLLTPGQLLYLAQKAPRTPWAVRSICPEVSVFSRHIADRVKTGLSMSDPPDVKIPPKRRFLTRYQRLCYRQLRDAVAARAEQLDIPAMHLARKSDLVALARQMPDANPLCLRGWRLEAIGRDLQQISGGFIPRQRAPGPR
ncbi:MAG: HRDC domain-containing protein [Bacteroidota bacterium]|nr:HRDC domain-containing protein [Bacteroidota bacterium]MDE2835343.1 HRDC domain-containing protein [Bacteroidota bacterium]MDE2956698.1 HRDC domain-containing protein [Bacteroidota bacterium]